MVQETYRAEVVARSGGSSSSGLAGAKGPHLLDYNRILRAGTSYYDEFVKDSEALSETDRIAWAKFMDDKHAAMLRGSDDRADWSQAHGGNSEAWLLPRLGESREAFSDRVGMFMLEISAPSWPEPVHNMKTARKWVTIADVVCALALYRQQHGSYPELLEGLSPDLLRVVPKPDESFTINYQLRGLGYELNWIRITSAHRNDDIVVKAEK